MNTPMLDAIVADRPIAYVIVKTFEALEAKGLNVVDDKEKGQIIASVCEKLHKDNLYQAIVEKEIERRAKYTK